MGGSYQTVPQEVYGRISRLKNKLLLKGQTYEAGMWLGCCRISGLCCWNAGMNEYMPNEITNLNSPLFC